ncbi:rubrerythrin [Thermincola ferriacetica]|uniref:Rubrerythrin n=1 Tax=Thermincola ferriacetica TaxID=281456 RepID=A0A0L6W611_9FIRM|nr:ferritin family protein [Thermincola ferriacetica]KNZ70945.1 rubrerythrin [Thermincola ferriacetica]
MNTETLTEKEIAQMAIDIEERGVRFYTGVAEMFNREEVKLAFYKLAEEEKEHARTFRQLFASLEPESSLEDVKTVEYLKAIIHSTVFPEGREEAVLQQIKTPAEALHVGIQAEKDAILFYQEMYNKSRSPKVKEVLSRLLEEEKLHLVDLRNYVDEMK